MGCTCHSCCIFGKADDADGIKLFYLDMNTVVDDGKGGLVKDYTWDDIHLQAQYYSLWEQYLYEHGLKDDAFK